MTEKDDLTNTLEDIASTAVDVTSMADKQPMVLTTDGERIPQAEFVKRNAPADTWLDADPETTSKALARRGENRNVLIQWVRANLNEGSDFGVIKGKQSLWKAGAEKIAGMLGLQVSWPDLDVELNRLRDGADVIFISCELIRGDAMVAQGAGARHITQDDGDWNKAIKMAKKSAMIDAVLNVGGLSEVFTQDIEDDDLNVATLSETSQQLLYDVAVKCAGSEADADVWLERLARLRFQFDDGDWRRIPSFRLADAIRSLEEKAEDAS